MICFSNFSEFKGLIPGAMGNLNVLNPFAIMSAFMSGATPPCQQITMQTVDVNNNKSSESHYVTLSDIANINPCSFPKGINPITKVKCKETFQPNMDSSFDAAPFPEDPLEQLYFAGLAGLGVFMLYRIMEKAQ